MNMSEGPMDGAEGVGIDGGKYTWVRQGKVVVGKWRQLYSNINKKSKKNEFIVTRYIRKRMLNEQRVYELSENFNKEIENIKMKIENIKNNQSEMKTISDEINST